jgi:DNA topoisomerase-3
LTPTLNTTRTQADKKVSRHLADVARGCDAVVLCLDNDKEGENICFEVLDIVEPMLRRGVRGRKVYRARFSALTASDIAFALNNLQQPDLR